MFYPALFRTRGSVAGVAVLLARESTASEPLVASVRNIEPQVYLLLQNEAESRCSTTDQISRPWSKSKRPITRDRKSTRLNSSHGYISYAVFCLKKKKK